jgi:hypothetical protein
MQAINTANKNLTPHERKMFDFAKQWDCWINLSQDFFTIRIARQLKNKRLIEINELGQFRLTK